METASIREARLANLSPRYPAPTVMTQPVAWRENARVPSWVAVRPMPILISGRRMVWRPEVVDVLYGMAQYDGAGEEYAPAPDVGCLL